MSFWNGCSYQTAVVCGNIGGFKASLLLGEGLKCDKLVCRWKKTQESLSVL